MHPAEQRLANLKELFGKENDSLYAQDLKLTIKQVEKELKRVNKKGYQMVEV